MRSGEITFKLSDDVFNEAVELVARKTSLMGAVNHPIAEGIEARMFDDVAKHLGKTLLTKSQKILFIGRCGVQTEEEKVNQDRFTFFVNPSDTPFLLDLLSQKAALEKACEEQPDRKGEFMWEIEKLCCRIGNVLVLKNQGLMINREPAADKEPQK